MDINDKKFTRTRTIVNTLITVVLAGFLIMLGNNVIGDLDTSVQYPNRSEFEDKELKAKLDKEELELNNQIKDLNESKQNIERMIMAAQTNKDAEQESFDNWIKTRGTLGSAQQDAEVLKRLAKLDEYKEIVQSWQAKSDSLSEQIREIYTVNEDVYNTRYEEDRRIEKLYQGAIQSYDLKVFLIRLLFTAPILALGVYFFMRKRRHKFSPLFMGFSLFAVYVFFFGLVPYLPSYGGYVRYTVGILLTLGLGYYAIKRLRAYQERKSAELKASNEERASRMEGERAEKAFQSHVCPSCGKDFLLKNWEKIDVDANSVKPAFASKYCRYCGLQLIKKCEHCSQDNYAHLPFCINCGSKLK